MMARRAARAEGEPILQALDVAKTYGSGDTAVHALRGTSITLRAGTVTAVVGPSGSGKSTLMHVLSGLDSASDGEVWIAGKRLSEQSETERARLRARHIGFVLQRDNLVPSLTVEENVATPLILAGMRRVDALRLARQTLPRVALEDRMRAWPSTLSGGEAQRAAVARACAGQPRMIFCDEPTGALDSAAGRLVLDLLVSLAREQQAATLIVTHDVAATELADHIVRMEDGRIEHVP